LAGILVVGTLAFTAASFKYPSLRHAPHLIVYKVMTVVQTVLPGNSALRKQAARLGISLQTGASLQEIETMMQSESSPSPWEDADMSEKFIIDDPAQAEAVEAVRQAALASGCPRDIIRLLDKNPETLEFVRDYAEKKDIPPAEQISGSPEGLLVPHLLQWDERWGYQPYGPGTIAVNGCGPTCMSMVIAGLTGDNYATPYQLAVYGDQHGLVNRRGQTSWDFMSIAARAWGLQVTQASQNEERVRQELANGHPIICRVGPGDFTQVGHFIVLTGYIEGYVTVNDPFSLQNSGKFWLYSDIADQITLMWIYSVKES